MGNLPFMKILVLEHSRVQQIIIKALLNEVKLSADFVSSFKEAVDAISEKDYDFVFTGYSLPDGNGVDLVRYLRTSSRNVPGVALLTTENNRALLNQALSAGVARIITRNNTQELQSFIRELADAAFDVNSLTGNILLIDDDRIILRIIEATISAVGSTVMACSSGEEAIRLISENDFDLIIADYFLDGQLNGLDVLEALRKMGGKKARIPLMMISAQTDVNRRIEILKKGASDYIAKPILEEELLVRAHNLIVQKKLLDRVEEQREHLRQLAMTDQLTGLYNRHFLSGYVPKRISEAIRHGSYLSLILVDLDYFKSINDNYGHEVGDDVLQLVASKLNSISRAEDIAVRLGGEEFILLLPHCDKQGALEKAESLRHQIEQLNPCGIKVTASFGVVSINGSDFQGKDFDFSNLFSAADKAVYKAKDQGRNCVVYQAIEISDAI
jgi:two-component system cell cycle response regulator